MFHSRATIHTTLAHDASYACWSQAVYFGGEKRLPVVLKGLLAFLFNSKFATEKYPLSVGRVGRKPNPAPPTQSNIYTTIIGAYISKSNWSWGSKKA